MPKRREVTPSGGSDRVRNVGRPSESNKRGRWSAERHATVQGSLSSSDEISAIPGKFAFQEIAHEKMISFSLNDQQEYQEQQGSSNQDTQAGPDQASASNVEQVDEAKCQQIVEQLINPPSKRKRMPRVNEKEVGKIMNILEEKKNEGIISDEKYNHCQHKMQKKVQNAKYHKDNKDDIKTKKAKYYKDNKGAIKTKRAKNYKDNKDDKKAKNAKYYENNREAILVQKAEYYEDNIETIKAKSAEYRENNRETIKAKSAEYRENNRETIKAQNAKYYENNKDTILAERAKKCVQKYQEALQKVNDAIVALEQEITSLQQQPSLPADTKQLLSKKQRLLRKYNTSKKRSEEALARNLEKAQRLIQIQQELDELIGREAPSHRDLQESLPNAAEESSSPHATQEIRPLEERYHHWLNLSGTSHDAHLIGTAQDLYAEYRELQRHFEEELGPLLADFA